MIRTDYKPWRLRRELFYVAALIDLIARIISAHFSWDELVFSTDELAQVPGLAVDSGVSVPTFGLTIFLCLVASFLAQGAVVVDRSTRLVSATLLLGSLMIFSTQPATSAFIAMLGYLVITSSQLDADL